MHVWLDEQMAQKRAAVRAGPPANPYWSMDADGAGVCMQKMKLGGVV